MDDERYCGQCRQLDREIERLRAQLARVAAWAYCRSSVDRGWQPYFELDSNIDQILRPYLDKAGGDDE
jgi:hypothetical protein